MGNNSQGSHPPLKTAQQAPHQQSFEKEMSAEQNAHRGGRGEPHFQIINIVFQSNPNTLRDLGKVGRVRKESR